MLISQVCDYGLAKKTSYKIQDNAQMLPNKKQVICLIAREMVAYRKYKVISLFRNNR